MNIHFGTVHSDKSVLIGKVDVQQQYVKFSATGDNNHSVQLPRI